MQKNVKKQTVEEKTWVRDLWHFETNPWICTTGLQLRIRILLFSSVLKFFANNLGTVLRVHFHQSSKKTSY